MSDDEEESSLVRSRGISEGDELVRFRRWIAMTPDTKWREFRGTADMVDCGVSEDMLELVDSMMLARMCHFDQMMSGWRIMRGGLTTRNAKWIYSEMMKSLSSLQHFELQNFSNLNSWTTPQNQSAFPKYLSDLPVRDGGTMSAIMGGQGQSQSTPLVLRLVTPDSENENGGSVEFLRQVFGDFVPKKLLEMFQPSENRVVEMPDDVSGPSSSTSRARNLSESDAMVETPILRSSDFVRSGQTTPERSRSSSCHRADCQQPMPRVPRKQCSGIGFVHSPDWRFGTRVTLLNPSGPSPEEEPILLGEAPLFNANMLQPLPTRTEEQQGNRVTPNQPVVAEAPVQGNEPNSSEVPQHEDVSSPNHLSNVQSDAAPTQKAVPEPMTPAPQPSVVPSNPKNAQTAQAVRATTVYPTDGIGPSLNFIEADFALSYQQSAPNGLTLTVEPSASHPSAHQQLVLPVIDYTAQHHPGQPQVAPPVDSYPTNVSYHAENMQEEAAAPSCAPSVPVPLEVPSHAPQVVNYQMNGAPAQSYTQNGPAQFGYPPQALPVPGYAGPYPYSSEQSTQAPPFIAYPVCAPIPLEYSPKAVPAPSYSSNPPILSGQPGHAMMAPVPQLPLVPGYPTNVQPSQAVPATTIYPTNVAVPKLEYTAADFAPNYQQSAPNGIPQTAAPSVNYPTNGPPVGPQPRPVQLPGCQQNAPHPYGIPQHVPSAPSYSTSIPPLLQTAGPSANCPSSGPLPVGNPNSGHPVPKIASITAVPFTQGACQVEPTLDCPCPCNDPTVSYNSHQISDLMDEHFQMEHQNSQRMHSGSSASQNIASSIIPPQVLQQFHAGVGGNRRLDDIQVMAYVVVQRANGEMVNMGLTPINYNALRNSNLMNGARGGNVYTPRAPPNRQRQGGNNGNNRNRRQQQHQQTQQHQNQRSRAANPVRSQPSTPGSGAGSGGSVSGAGASSVTPPNDSGFSSTSEQEHPSTRGSTPAPSTQAPAHVEIVEEVVVATELTAERASTPAVFVVAKGDKKVTTDSVKEKETPSSTSSKVENPVQEDKLESDPVIAAVGPPKLVLSYASIVKGKETIKTDRHATTSSSSSPSSALLTSSAIGTEIETKIENGGESDRLDDCQESPPCQTLQTLKNDEEEWTLVRNKHPVVILVIPEPNPIRKRPEAESRVVEVLEGSDDEVKVDEEKEKVKEKRSEQRRLQRAAKVRRENERKKAEAEERARQLALQKEAESEDAAVALQPEESTKEEQCDREGEEMTEEEQSPAAQSAGTPALLQGGYLGTTYSATEEAQLRKAEDDKLAEEVVLNAAGQRKFRDSDIINEEIEEDDPTEPRELMHIESRDHAKIMFRLLWFDNKKKLEKLYIDEPTRKIFQDKLNMVRTMKNRLDTAGRMIVYRVGRPQIADHIEESMVTVARNLIDVTRQAQESDLTMAKTICELVGRMTKNFTYQNYVFCILTLSEDLIPRLKEDDPRVVGYKQIVTLAKLHIARVKRVYQEISDLYDFRINLVPKRRPRR